MVSIFSVVFILALLVILGSMFKFAHTIKVPKITKAAFMQTLKDICTLKYLGRHKNEGCTYPNENRSNIRKIFHHFTAYGFIFCFIATSLGASYHHVLHIIAPYDISQLPKIFGIVGGIMLCIGTIGLFILKIIADKNILEKKVCKWIMLLLLCFS